MSDVTPHLLGNSSDASCGCGGVEACIVRRTTRTTDTVEGMILGYSHSYACGTVLLSRCIFMTELKSGPNMSRLAVESSVSGLTVSHLSDL